MAARAQSRVSVAVLAVRVPAQYYNSCLAAGDTIIIDGDQPHTTINTTIIPTRGKLGGTSLPYFGVKLSCVCLLFALQKLNN